MSTPKVPAPPPARLTRSTGDVLAFGDRLRRITRTTGDHVLAWDRFRHFGWINTMRWDPHPTPMTEHPDYAVMYLATSIAAAVAEVFRATRTIDTITGSPVLLSWAPTRPLRLLDLGGEWPMRNGAARSLAHLQKKEVCRSWARAIHDRWDDIDGLYVDSTMTGTNVVLFERAATAIPGAPESSRALTDPVVLAVLERIAAFDRINYKLI